MKEMIGANGSIAGELLITLAKLSVGLVFSLALMSCATSEKHVKHEIPRLYSSHDTQFLRTMGVLLGPAIAGGNRFESLQNGDEIFPAMLQAIRSAQKTVDFETYIYWSGAIGKEFTEALSERARAGVKVHVLIDWLGSESIDPDFIRTMKQAGVEINKYHSLRWYNVHRLNYRTHRKLLIVDGRIGFTGGVGIADQWGGHAQDKQHWRDSQFKVEGPVVAQMQAAFMDNWIKVTGEVLHGADYFPALASAGNGAAQMFTSSPTGGADSMELMYLLAITAAERSIYLKAAYFVPDKLTMQALVAALKRGVKVQIITPSKGQGQFSDEVVRHASHARWGQLLEAGAEMYEYQPTFYHCKMMIVDDRFVSVGSANFDSRSFRLNDEANLNVYDAAFARQQTEDFRQDLAQSRKMTFDQWRERPLGKILLENGAALLGPQL